MADRYFVYYQCDGCERKCQGRWIVEEARAPEYCLDNPKNRANIEIWKIERAMFCPKCGSLTTIIKSVDVEGNKEREHWWCSKCNTMFENEVEVKDVV